MGWLLELLIKSIWEFCSQLIVDMMSVITDMFTELLSCDLSLFEELFSVAGDLYSNAILPLGIALLLLICIWQLFKSMFGKTGVASEDPVELVLIRIRKANLSSVTLVCLISIIHRLSSLLCALDMMRQRSYGRWKYKTSGFPLRKKRH